jgi:tRNA nucleotidyltransferase (CCA-adding enzyme)
MLADPILLQLASVFPATLYAVGGAVRDSLLGFAPKDVDLASDMLPEEVARCLKNTGFVVLPTSPKLGTLKIKGFGKEYEYTAFRIDSYAAGGSHAPEDVRFTSDLAEDAGRRDFTADAIYYNIKKGEYVDPLGGIYDIEKRLLRATRSPEEVMREDGLRLLRLVRIACSCGFEIDPDLYEASRKYRFLLKDVHDSRIGEEFSKIIVCDTFYDVKGAHTRAIRMLLDLGLMDFILPELLECKGFPQRTDYHKYDVLEHIIRVFDLSPPQVRMAALFHDSTKPLNKITTGKMAGHEFTGAMLLRKRLKKLCFSNDDIERWARLVEAHMYDLKCETGEKKLRLFVQKNADILHDLVALKDADYLGSGMHTGRNPSGIRMEETYRTMREEGVPFSIKELKVDGNDLIAAGIPPAERGKTMEELMHLAANDACLRTAEGQKAFLATKIQIPRLMS